MITPPPPSEKGAPLFFNPCQISDNYGFLLVRYATDNLPNKVKAAELIKNIRGLGRRTHYSQVDVTDAHAVHKWFSEAEASLGSPSIVIITAAVITLKDIRTVSAELWDREIQVNLNGAFRVAQAGALSIC